MRTTTTIYFVVLLALGELSALLGLSGCSATKEVWKATKNLYYEYVEPRPTINLDVSELGNLGERRLAKLFKPIDERVYALCKFLDGEDQPPQQEWFRVLFDRFPWISGAMVMDTLGEIQFQHPADFSNPEGFEALRTLIKQYGSSVDSDAHTIQEMERTNRVANQGEGQLAVVRTASGLDSDKAMEDIAPSSDFFVENISFPNATNKASELERIEKKSQPEENRLRGDHEVYVIDSNSTSGSEIYFAQPFFKRNIWSGFVVVSFNLSNLLEFCSAPDDLIILSSDKILWATKYQEEVATFMHGPWKQLLTKQVVGIWSQNGKFFYWLDRQLGNYHLVYAIAIEKPSRKISSKIDKGSKIDSELATSISSDSR